MENLILINNGSAILEPETAAAIAEFERQAKAIKEKEDALKEAILHEMQNKCIFKVETPELSITYVAATDRESLDSKRLKQELPDVYDSFVKISKVKPSVRLRLK
jgi:predicted phage-related endonuclease